MPSTETVIAWLGRHGWGVPGIMGPRGSPWHEIRQGPRACTTWNRNPPLEPDNLKEPNRSTTHGSLQALHIAHIAFVHPISFPGHGDGGIPGNIGLSKPI